MRIANHLPDKPRLGDACNGCGVCCAMIPCQISVDIIGVNSGRCQALEVENGRAHCGIVRRPAYYMFGENVNDETSAKISVLFASALGFGVGCDAEDYA